MIEFAAKRRNLDGQIGILDNSPAPDRRHDLFFCDETAGPLDQNNENIESSEADGYWNEDTVFVPSRQAVALPIEAKFLEQKNVGRCEHAPAFSFRCGQPFHPALRRPSSMCA